MSSDLREAALDYHRLPTPGKIAVAPTKPLATQRDLALAYSPGVAAACEAIVADPQEASRVTSRANLVAVISNGTAVLGLGNIGPLASKPVMEGKGVLFKKFAGIDVFDIEIDETDPDKLVDIIVALEPTFGGINLEDIKAPECFEVESKARSRMKIPVFHDDQHGTAIIVAAAITNGLRVVGKDLASVKLVTSGAGAAARVLDRAGDRVRHVDRHAVHPVRGADGLHLSRPRPSPHGRGGRAGRPSQAGGVGGAAPASPQRTRSFRIVEAGSRSVVIGPVTRKPQRS